MKTTLGNTFAAGLAAAGLAAAGLACATTGTGTGDHAASTSHRATAPPASRPAASARARRAPTDPDAIPPGVQQIIPRGAIAAISEPTFVAAAEADIPDDAWVLGVDIGDAPRAYSLNLLNHHEVVNDEAGGRSFAAVW